MNIEEIRYRFRILRDRMGNVTFHNLEYDKNFSQRYSYCYDRTTIDAWILDCENWSKTITVNAMHIANELWANTRKIGR